jgi:hypothetical protein
MGVTSGEKAILWRVAADIEIVGSKVVGRSARQAGDLGGLQRRLDNAGDARRHLILKLEDISSSEPSKRSAHRCVPVSYKIGFLTGFRYV